MTRKDEISIGSLLLSLWLAVPAAQGAPHRSLEMWVRAAGEYGGGGAPPRRQGVRTVDLEAQPLQQVRRADVQYEGTFHYRGVPLRALIAQYGPPPQADLALLHFWNGMLVPLPFRDERAMARLDPFLALDMRLGGGEPYGGGQFPSIDRRVESYADARLVAFRGNKLVVSDRLHPAVPERVQTTFTPWSAVGSLSGIEFVNGAAYYRQLDPEPGVRAGLELFKQSCQFCHGVSRIGASFGCDYTRFNELDMNRGGGLRLFYHIRYRGDDPAGSRMMPVLRHVTEDEAGLLWQWMRAVVGRPLPPYQP